MSGVFEHLDEVLARVMRERDQLLRGEFAADRAARLALVFAAEAEVWSQFYELSSLRMVWRAALAAEAGARANAAVWARRAVRERAGALSAAAGVAGGMSAARPVALISTRMGDGQ